MQNSHCCVDAKQSFPTFTMICCVLHSALLWPIRADYHHRRRKTINQTMERDSAVVERFLLERQNIISLFFLYLTGDIRCAETAPVCTSLHRQCVLEFAIRPKTINLAE